MKTLQNHLILFDAECPMCNLYTKAFVATGMLDENGREAYQQYPAETCPLLNRQRAVNEIALINRSTGEVTYGVRSLLKIFTSVVPVLGPLFSFAPLVWLLSKFYAFISYNRRVIIPAVTDDYQYQPTFRLSYRLLYIAFTWFITAYILTDYVHLMQGVLPQGNTYREYLVCGGQLVFQGLIICFIARNKIWSYLGNMMTISFGGALLLLPGLIVNHWFSINPVWYAVYFMAVAGTMFLEHIRRTGLLNLGYSLSISWATYRALILVAITLIK
ncbi:hypothetical protein BDD43_2622 [Mucilaginibacter gracilis]|uniref:Uncharacterized protein n=1 Tax=Mucilaginibacter gracilis TaxID=423350 RepID=A0A495J151_9SPHI|nr:DUF393 domain-containing protein [Mucilaginibacter gracilis]RKR82442.1 hypothetical protein BDD43_2622 [Mucilaginibacter gracilis]